MQAYKERRRANGQCLDCGMTSEKSRCPECYSKALATNRRWWRRHHPIVNLSTVCPICGVEFCQKPTGPRSLYCSAKCRRRVRTLREGPYHRIYMYGFILAEYNSMLAEQDNQCWLCRRPFPEAPQIDHAHDCPNKANHRNQSAGHGRRQEFGCPECVRGLLCRFCNTVVVRFLETYPDRMTETERTYFADRPIKRYRFGAETTRTET